MKNKIIISFFVALILGGLNISLAQSDYEVVQSFKNKAQNIERSIREGASLNTLDELSGEINTLRDDYAKNKSLLDKGLYPENYDGTIRRLENALSLRKGDFTQITELETEVTGLRTEVDTLTRRNNDLTQQFALLEAQSKTDRSKIAQLEGIVAQLRASLRKRDEIVMNMIDSLLPGVYGGEELSTEQGQQLVNKAEQNNVIFHIRRAVSDNIRFLRATELKADDIEEVMDQQEKFSKIWRSVGPRMLEVYAERGKGTAQLKEIDESFTTWQSVINNEVWQSIQNQFEAHNISLREFSNGDEFTAVITSYINDEIKAIEGRSDAEAEAKYKNFADSTWYTDIEPAWMDFLIDKKLVTGDQKDQIEERISFWKDTIYPESFNWMYVVVAGLVVIIIVLLVLVLKARKKPAHQGISV